MGIAEGGTFSLVIKMLLESVDKMGIEFNGIAVKLEVKVEVKEESLEEKRITDNLINNFLGFLSNKLINGEIGRKGGSLGCK